MSKNILVIGGTRFFGKHLVRRLLVEGNRVSIATRGISADDFGGQVRRIRVDRRNLQAMQAAFANEAYFDVVYDQMCYSPLDAAISLDVFATRVGRYIMSSTIETYRPLLGRLERPYVEEDIDLQAETIDLHYPWHDPTLAEASYSAGKRQAEALLLQDGRLPVVMLRIAHVLAGKEDFTGRLASYISAVIASTPASASDTNTDLSGKPRGNVFHYLASAGVTSFLNVAVISDFMVWAGRQDFSGPINVACTGHWSALDLYRRICQVLGKSIAAQNTRNNIDKTAQPGNPFDYAHAFAMDTSRATQLGYHFPAVDTWLDALILDLHSHMLATPSVEGA